MTVFPNTVGAATPVTLTVRDARGNTAQSAVTVQPRRSINALKLKADCLLARRCPNPTGSANPTDEIVSTFICSGQTGSRRDPSRQTLGGGIAGRLVRFDIVQGAFQIFTELPGQPPTFALTLYGADRRERRRGRSHPRRFRAQPSRRRSCRRPT